MGDRDIRAAVIHSSLAIQTVATMNRLDFRCAAITWIGAVLWLASAVPARAEDWPQWRGPNRDGAWHETGLLETFPSVGLKVRWRVPVGWGFSTPVVAKG